MCLCLFVIVSGGRVARRDGGGDLWTWLQWFEGGFGIVLSLGICPKFTPAPHFPASVGVMRGGEGERHSWA